MTLYIFSKMLVTCTPCIAHEDELRGEFNIKVGLVSTLLIAVMYSLPCYIEPIHNGTWLYIKTETEETDHNYIILSTSRLTHCKNDIFPWHHIWHSAVNMHINTVNLQYTPVQHGGYYGDQCLHNGPQGK